MGIGLQHKSVEELEKELQLPPNQILAMFNKIVKKLINILEEINVNQVDKILFANDKEKNYKALDKLQPLKQSLEEELNEASRKIRSDEIEQKKQMLNTFDFKQYEIKGSEKEWVDVLKLPLTNSYVSVKRMTEKRKIDYQSHFDAAQDSISNGHANGDDKKKFKKNKKEKRFNGKKDTKT